MDERIQHKINELKNIMSVKQTTYNTINPNAEKDALSMSIRSEKDAKIFLDELKTLIEKLR